MSINDATEVEKNIAVQLVRQILRQGFTISVFDSEEMALVDSRDEAEILEAMCTTDDDRLYVGGTERIGSFWLIYGNGEDLISDYSWNASVATSKQIMDQINDDTVYAVAHPEPIVTPVA